MLEETASKLCRVPTTLTHCSVTDTAWTSLTQPEILLQFPQTNHFTSAVRTLNTFQALQLEELCRQALGFATGDVAETRVHPPYTSRKQLSVEMGTVFSWRLQNLRFSRHRTMSQTPNHHKNAFGVYSAAGLILLSIIKQKSDKLRKHPKGWRAELAVKMSVDLRGPGFGSKHRH